MYPIRRTRKVNRKAAAQHHPYGFDSPLNFGRFRAPVERARDPNIQIGGLVRHNGIDLADKPSLGNRAWSYIGSPQLSYEGTSHAEHPDPTSRIHTIAL